MYSEGIVMNQWQSFFLTPYEKIRNYKEFKEVKRKGKEIVFEDSYREFRKVQKEYKRK